MKRVMVNLDLATGALLEAQAVKDKRSVSSYVAKLVESDLRSSGLLVDAAPHATLIATAEELGVEDSIKLLDREARKRRKSSATDHKTRRSI